MTSRLRGAMLIFAVIVSLVAVVLTAYGTSVRAQQPERVNFALDWFVHGKHVMYYPAIEQGIYQKYGLSVNMVRGFGSGDTIQKVDQKTVPFGFADMSTLVLLRAKGAKVVEVGMIHHLMPHAIFFLKGSGIRTPKDLEGRTFSTPAGNAVWVLLPAFAKSTGFDHTKIRHVPADAAASNVSVLAGKVDAAGIFWTVYPTIAAEAKKLGKELGYFKYSDYGLDLYANGLIVHEDLIREKPDLVQRFVRATFEGIHWALKNPEKAFEIYMKQNPEQDREKAWGEWTTAIDMFGAVAKRARTPLQLAWMDPAKAGKTVEIIGELYKLESPVKPGETYTNRFAEPLP
ncbi:MAG: ABC transporter substrate-binding protein [Candidatus Rokubacteria bacterium]|nr:ABC transporter substrate-binding protein [Candidatus Rokubacteria bacterium]